MISMPRSICLRTTSATAARRRAAWVFASMGLPSSLARTTSSRSAGRGRLPTWGVRIRSMLRFMVPHAASCCRSRAYMTSPLTPAPPPPPARGGGPWQDLRIRPPRHAFARERRLEFLANGGILLVIRYGAAAFAEIDSAVVHELLAGTAGLARALVVGPVPGGDAQ